MSVRFPFVPPDLLPLLAQLPSSATPSDLLLVFGLDAAGLSKKLNCDFLSAKRILDGVSMQFKPVPSALEEFWDDTEFEIIVFPCSLHFCTDALAVRQLNVIFELI
jgi:hypothetical protein